MTSFAIRAVGIILLSICLLFAAMFVVILPSLENAILEQKREMIRELTNSAWNIMARHEQDVAAGLISREEAIEQSIQQLRSLHYGQQMKDYFWVNDMQPRMIVHPYRTELEGKDLSDFRAPDGKKIFVEMVDIVKHSGSGYLKYRWQWKDNPERVVEKISFVKGFKPWGWVIGTGVYIDDVQKEIATARHKLLIVTLIILLAVLVLLGFLLWESIATDKKRLKAEAALQQSEEKYRKLVESSGECLLLQIGQDSLFANQSMLHLLECDWDDLAGMQMAEIFAPTHEETSQGQRFFQRFLRGEPVPAIYETRITTRSGEVKEVTVSFSSISIKGQQGLVAVTTDISQRRRKEAIQEAFLREAQTGNRFWEKPVIEIADLSIKEVETGTLSELMLETEKNLVLRGEAGFSLLSAEKILSQLNSGKSLEQSFKECQWATNMLISPDTPAWQALAMLHKNSFMPLILIDEKQQVKGVVSATELAATTSFSPHLMQLELKAAQDREELKKINQRFFEWITYLVRSGIKASMINRMITDNTDLVTQQAVKMAQKQLGKAPVAWSFVVLGSAARQEQTLCTDQDNAIIFADVACERIESVRKYFIEFADLICSILADCGYKECKGGFMASNEKWCKSSSEWLSTYEKWLTASEAQDLLHAKIFFDIRTVAGDHKLLATLMQQINERLDNLPGFFFLLARNVLLFQPPLSFLGNFVADPDVKDREVINLKGIMALISDFARIYSLKYHFPANNSCRRLEAMHSHELLSDESLSEIKRMFEFLMDMRLEHQAREIFHQRPVDNYLEPASLSALDQTALKEILAQIKTYQVRLSYDFTGTMNQQV